MEKDDTVLSLQFSWCQMGTAMSLSLEHVYILIEQFKHPEGLGKYECIPGFAIYGLHYDVHLMKIDAFHYVQLGTVDRGLKAAPDEEVTELYGGMQHVPLYQVSDFYGKSPSLQHFMDIFSFPEMTLLSPVIDSFITHGIEFDQLHLYKDAIGDVHVKGVMYKWTEMVYSAWG
ncbi:hypothetical protein Q9966_007437 [Columba livia]|nr:hypothetical protein Q9966_007437 [Columba livia]